MPHESVDFSVDKSIRDTGIKYNPDFVRRVWEKRRVEEKRQKREEAKLAKEKIIAEQREEIARLKEEIERQKQEALETLEAQEREEKEKTIKDLKNKKPHARNIIRSAAAHHGIRFEDVIGDSRNRRITEARHDAVAAIK